MYTHDYANMPMRYAVIYNEFITDNFRKEMIFSLFVAQNIHFG